jgi:hypothetical protein
LLVPAVTKQFQLADATAAEMDLSRLDLLLRAYRAEHESFPDQLQALLPDYLDVVPTDPFSSQPYVYRRDGATAHLYSAGNTGRELGDADLVVELVPTW